MVFLQDSSQYYIFKKFPEIFISLLLDQLLSFVSNCDWECSSVIEDLPSMLEVLSCSPNTIQKGEIAQWVEELAS